MRQQATALFLQVQQDLCSRLEAEDGKALFQRDTWERPDLEGGFGGGGTTQIIQDGAVFEKGGVNFSEVSGTLSAEMCAKLVGVESSLPFFATGISVVMHPFSPMVPTTHANYRYLEVGEKKWFGGGCDLTPYYLFPEDAKHFHATLKDTCDRFDTSLYPKWKQGCDEYFYLPHRQETRGIGGIFFDYLGRDEEKEKLPSFFEIISNLAPIFYECYLPIVRRRKHLSFTEDKKRFQLLRRGRYVEFNLLYDRGTLFGLKTGGRTESIFMSLPPEVRWEYDFQVEKGSSEAQLLQVLQNPVDWAI